MKGQENQNEAEATNHAVPVSLVDCSVQCRFLDGMQRELYVGFSEGAEKVAFGEKAYLGGSSPVDFAAFPAWLKPMPLSKTDCFSTLFKPFHVLPP